MAKIPHLLYGRNLMNGPLSYAVLVKRGLALFADKYSALHKMTEEIHLIMEHAPFEHHPIEFDALGIWDLLIKILKLERQVQPNNQRTKDFDQELEKALRSLAPSMKMGLVVGSPAYASGGIITNMFESGLVEDGNLVFVGLIARYISVPLWSSILERRNINLTEDLSGAMTILREATHRRPNSLTLVKLRSHNTTVATDTMFIWNTILEDPDAL